MKYLAVTYYGECFPIMEKLQKEGNKVIVTQIEDPKWLDKSKENPEEKKRRMADYNGILDKRPLDMFLRQAKAEKNKDDWFVFLGMNHLWKVSEVLLKYEYKKGIFPTKEDFEMEEDRDKAQQFMQKYYTSMDFKEKKEFKKVDDAKKFLETTTKFWVLKGYDDDAATVVPKQNDVEAAKSLLMGTLESDKKKYEKDGFLLQEMIMEPVEFTPEMAFWNGKPIFTNTDIETKYSGSGDTGRQVGCGTSLVVKTPLGLPMHKKVFPPIVYEMAKKHTGLFIWDLGILEKDGKMYPTEFCPNRFGWDSVFAELAMSGDENGKKIATPFFENIVAGKNPLKYQFSTTVRLFNEHITDLGMYVEGDVVNVTDTSYPDTYVWGVKKDKESWKTTAYMKDLAIITGFSNDSPEDAATKMYKYVKEFGFDSPAYRDMQDYLRTDYPTAIMTRFNTMKEKGIIPELNAGKSVGYDYDGVVTEGVRPQKDSIIITGETKDKISKVEKTLDKMNAPNVPIKTYPNKEDLKTTEKKRQEIIGNFKANQVKKLGLKIFYEDNPIQSEIIRKRTKASVVEVNNQSK